MSHAESLLIANRGEIAIRIARTAADLGLRTVGVHPADDTGAHLDAVDETALLPGRGVGAYLDAGAVVAAAIDAGCGVVHPGYGLLSERPVLAAACAQAGVSFVGPSPEVLEIFGDKHATLALARSVGAPVLDATDPAGGLDAARQLLEDGPVMVKAVAGGGGRGLRVARDGDELDEAWARSSAEAASAFGDGRCYAERHLPRARHIEIQLAADAAGGVVVLGDRECSLQRRHQKLLELAPAPSLTEGVRARCAEAALALGRAAELRGLGTVELLVDVSAGGEDGSAEGSGESHAGLTGAGPGGEDAPVAVIEVNPRLQVEHTVTEAVTGLDLVAIQLQLATGATLDELGLADTPPARGRAVQARVIAESLTAQATLEPSGGTITAWSPPTGPGVRVDAAVRVGDVVHPSFDPLLAKVIVWATDADVLTRRADRALGELVLGGPETTIGLLRALLKRPETLAGQTTTTYVEDHLGALAAEAQSLGTDPSAGAGTSPALPAATGDAARGRLGAGGPLGDGQVALVAPLAGTVVAIEADAGWTIDAGRPVVILEAMKMEHVVAAPNAGAVTDVVVAVGDVVARGDRLAIIATGDGAVEDGASRPELDLDHVRDDLAEVVERHEIGHDERRSAAVQRRRAVGRRTTRENVADLVDDDSFVEYGPLVLAAQRRRRPLDELIAKTPGDGLVGGVGTVDAARFGDAARTVVVSYDYTVLAGTQGHMNHLKKDRLFQLAADQRLPVVVFTEGGGGRPGDTDGTQVAGLDCLAFRLFGELSGQVPLVGINAGYCFAGNAALLGCCDVVIATEDSNIGMGGPAMIEGGGLGQVDPTDIGPIDVQWANGVVDLRAADEAEAVDLARRYLSYFCGPVADWDAADQRLLRHVVPENRLRVYDVRSAIELLCDTDSVLELRRGFAPGMITCLARIEGRPLGVVANDPTHLGGAIDSDGADKAARFLQLCDAFGLPVLFCCDTPGIMVGPDAEATATVRHAARLFTVGASISVPFATIVLRKGYGLGAQAMAGGSFRAPAFIVAWPTGEFGGMGLEGAVRLGYRDELAAIADPDERQAAYEERVAKMYEIGKGINFASVFEIDDVIDPADSRRWITRVLLAAAGPPGAPPGTPRRPCVDTW